MKIVYSSWEVVTGQRMINQINSVSVPHQSEFPLIDPRRAKTEKRRVERTAFNVMERVLLWCYWWWSSVMDNLVVMSMSVYQPTRRISFSNPRN